jgi:hypothetical protein
MPSETLQSEFNTWLDNALSEPIPPHIIAFAFNLSEPWSIDLIGSDEYSFKDSDWVLEETFRPDVDPLDLPKSEVGTTWQAVLEEAKHMVADYLDRPSAGSTILKKAEAITVGFVDGGALHKMWP